MKNKKVWFKLSLDLIMLIVFVLLLYKNNFGLAFHEIAGLFVLGAFLFHIILNWRWLVAVTKKLFSKNMKTRVRISWLLNLGLLICFALIGISGVFMSKIVFHFSVPGNWRVIHYFCTAVVIILLGAHLGLHAVMIGNAMRKVFHLKEVAARCVCIIFTVIFVSLGCYSFTSTSYVRWIMMPFQTQEMMAPGNHPDFNKDSAGSEVGNQNDKGQMNGNGEGPMNGQGKSQMNGNGEGPMNGQEMNHRKASIPMILWNFVQIFSMIYLIAAIVALLDRFNKCKEI